MSESGNGGIVFRKAGCARVGESESSSPNLGAGMGKAVNGIARGESGKAGMVELGKPGKVSMGSGKVGNGFLEESGNAGMGIDKSAGKSGKAGNALRALGESGNAGKGLDKGKSGKAGRVSRESGKAGKALRVLGKSGKDIRLRESGKAGREVRVFVELGKAGNAIRVLGDSGESAGDLRSLDPGNAGIFAVRLCLEISVHRELECAKVWERIN